MKWFNRIKNALTLLVFLIVVVLGSLIFLSAKQDLNGFRLLIVKSGSMEPTIKTGSLILVQKQAAYQKGDIVTFGPVTRPELLVTHRIIDVVDKEGLTYIQTKGDFNAAADQDLTPMAAVIARYVFALPYLGYVLGFAQTQVGVVVLIIIPGTILIYDEVMNLKRAIAKLYHQFRANKQQNTENQT